MCNRSSFFFAVCKNLSRIFMNKLKSALLFWMKYLGIGDEVFFLQKMWRNTVQTLFLVSVITGLKRWAMKTKCTKNVCWQIKLYFMSNYSNWHSIIVTSFFLSIYYLLLPDTEHESFFSVANRSTFVFNCLDKIQNDTVPSLHFHSERWLISYLKMFWSCFYIEKEMQLF